MAKKRRKAARKTTKRKAGKRRGGGGLTKMSYTVSPALAEVIRTKKATRPQIVKKLWVYIKARKLQDAKNRRMINPDAKLAAVFGSKKSVNMLKMAGLLNKHIKK